MCAVPPTMASKDVRFSAHFLGSHDDSQVSLRQVELNGTSVACRSGSKTESRFEDGEVTLSCRLTLPAVTSGEDRLTVKISLHHLQLEKTELVQE